MLEKFFAPEYEYPPCGLFTAGHFVWLAFSLILILIFLRLTYKKNDAFLLKFVRITGPLLIILEIIKILYKFNYGYFNLDAWVPISYCSIFMYASLCSGYGKGYVKKLGDAFITFGSFPAGIGFLLVPSTSLTIMPAYHFLAFHSMLYHSVMAFTGLSYIIRKISAFDLKNYLRYVLVFAVFAAVSVTLNSVTGCNLMTLQDPFLLPFVFRR